MKRTRTATNVVHDAALVEEANKLDLNLLREHESQLEVLDHERIAEQWCAENKKAIDDYAKFFTRHGVWNEGERGW